MTKQKHFFLTATLLLCSLLASAHDFEVGGIYYNITSSEDMTVEVTFLGEYVNSHEGEYSGAVTIPSIVTYKDGTYSVTSIGRSAFYGCNRLTAVTLPESVTSIGGYVFYDCTSLTSVNIPEGVTSIGNYAFYNCRSLTSITLPENVTEIREWTFSYCISLTAINIPEGVTSIGHFAFYECTSLTSVTLPKDSKLTSIGNYAFDECTSLATIIIPEGVTKIGNYAFSGYGSFASVSIPSSVTHIGEAAFLLRQFGKLTIEDGDSALYVGEFAFGGFPFPGAPIDTMYIGRELTYDADEYNEWSPFYGSEVLKHVTIGGGVKTFGYYLFDCCTALNTVVVNEGVVEIGYQAFDYCPSLKTVRLPESLTQIGDIAFFTCENLSELTIPEKVTSIGEKAFYNCSSLASITCKATTPPTIDNFTFYNVDKTVPVYVPSSSVADYQSAEGWKEFANFVGVDTSIDHSQLTIDHSQLIIYDLQGRRITDTTNLKGVYIVNGKKVIF